MSGDSKVEICRSEILDMCPVSGIVRLIDGEERHINELSIAEDIGVVAINRQLITVPYSGDESPSTIRMTETSAFRANLPA